LLPPELHFLIPICTKSFVGCGFAQTPLLPSAPPNTLAIFRGPTSKGRRGRKRREWKGRGGEEENRTGRGWAGTAGEGRGWRESLPWKENETVAAYVNY